MLFSSLANLRTTPRVFCPLGSQSFVNSIPRGQSILKSSTHVYTNDKGDQVTRVEWFNEEKPSENLIKSFIKQDVKREGKCELLDLLYADARTEKNTAEDLTLWDKTMGEYSSLYKPKGKVRLFVFPSRCTLQSNQT